ncbi:phage tail protein [Sphingomonas sp. Leaf37]|uniref:phage tail protein n=1 Tax=Sphingomonas sp. Leaf37 TaxID=2876552 RepID=UPI001E3C9504|nr:phage tail protein [Sphingomonas sp. Leaf37]
MSKTVKLIAGVALVVAGAVTGNLQLVLVGASLTSGALAQPKGSRREAAATSLQLGEAPRQGILGRVMTAGSLLDGFNYGGKYNTDWEVLAITLADHRCAALAGFYNGDVYVPFAANGFVAGYNNKLRVTWYAGTADQVADPTLIAHGGWSAADRLAGICYVVVEYKADAENEKNPTWPGGRPSFTWVVDGLLCYDPRKDSTVAGGSGPHRWADPSTREFSDNLAVCRYNWVRGIYACDRIDEPAQLLIGRGLSAIEAPPERVAAAANLCAEAVALATGGSEPRYRVSALVGADEEFGSVEEKFAAACAGVLIQPEGSIEVEPGHAKAPIAFFTDLDLVVGKPVTFSDFRSEADQLWCNTVVPRYNEPAQKWADHAAPVRRVVADLIADGSPRERPLPLEFVSSGTQAQRCGEIERRLGRLLRTATVTLGPRFSEIEEGDWVCWTSARRTGGRSVWFRVEGYQTDASWQMTLTLREVAASVFAWTAADEIAEGAVATQQMAPDPAAYVPGESDTVLQLAIRSSFIVEATAGIGIIAASADGSITIANHTRRYTDGDIAVAGATIASGLPAETSVSIAYDDVDRAGGAVTFVAYEDDAEAFASAAHPARHYVGFVTIPATGTSTGGGGGAGGGRESVCVVEDTLVLLANTGRTDGGITKRAADLVVGDILWTQHEVTRVWGAYALTEVSFHEADVFSADRLPIATAEHQFDRNGWWRKAKTIGQPCGSARVAKITVADARTYVTVQPDGSRVLNHNIKMQQPDEAAPASI